MELRKIEITTDTTIYVGYYGVHDCLKQGMAMEEFLGVLTDRKGKPLILKMKRCPVCGKVYLRGDKYQRLWCPLKKLFLYSNQNWQTDQRKLYRYSTVLRYRTCSGRLG